MKKFMAIKINYDDRESLPPHLKYSRPASKPEHDKYVESYKKHGKGGWGFHECMNFQKNNNSRKVYVYLPPGYLPSLKTIKNGELCIFSFTYEGDRTLKSHIVGVHGLCEVIGPKEGIIRNDIKSPRGIDPYIYHAVADSDYSTIFCEPIPYNLKDHRHLPEFKNNSWKQSRRYIKSNHAQNILIDAYESAQNAYGKSSRTKKMSIDEQLEIIERIYRHYFNRKVEDLLKKKKPKKKIHINHGHPHLPDKELGQLGEKIIFEREQKAAKKKGIPLEKVEWLSQSLPYSTFDIKTVREIEGEQVEMFLEVKTTRLEDFSNVHISQNQKSLAEKFKKNFLFVFVNITGHSKKKVIKITEHTLSELRKKYRFSPRSYKLNPIK